MFLLSVMIGISNKLDWHLLSNWKCGSNWQVKKWYECFPCLSTSLSLRVCLWCCKRQGANKLLNKLAARMDRASLVEVQDRNMVESLPF